jgi:type IV secretory pathway VirB10-like protein
MKRLLVVLPCLFLGLAACQRSAPERTAITPAPGASPAPAEAAATAAPGSPAESGASAPAAPAARSAPAAPAQGAPPPVRTEEARVAPPPPVPPTPAPTPTPRPLVLAAGTSLPLVLQTTLSTKTARPEDRVVAEIAQDVEADGRVVLPAGSELRGHVVRSDRSGRVKGRARMVVSFSQVRVGGRSYDIEATPIDVTAGSSKGKDAKIAGGAAAAGAIIGGIADGGGGALKGGLIGGAAGGAAVLATRGVEVELKAGSRHQIELRSALRVR